MLLEPGLPGGSGSPSASLAGQPQQRTSQEAPTALPSPSGPRWGASVCPAATLSAGEVSRHKCAWKEGWNGVLFPQERKKKKPLKSHTYVCEETGPSTGRGGWGALSPVRIMVRTPAPPRPANSGSWAFLSPGGRGVRLTHSSPRVHPQRQREWESCGLLLQTLINWASSQRGWGGPGARRTETNARQEQRTDPSCCLQE
jgi:hypothetical protein